VTTNCLLNDKRQGDTPCRAGCGVVVSALFLVMALFPQFSNAAGMEGIQVHSLLGQPLRAEINVSATREEQGSITARLASPEQFSQIGMTYSSEHATLRLSLEKRGENTIVVIRSTEPINEPYLDLLVELNWQAGRLTRGYTVLLDPPEVAAQSLYQPAVVSPSVSSSVTKPASQLETHAARPIEQPQPLVPPPATQPQARSAPAASSGTGYVVKKGDTLHRIAAANQLSGVSMEQMMVAIHRNNPDAFVGNNMNRLRQGAVLRLADEVDVSLITQAEANQVIRTQTAAWNQYRRTLASSAGSTDATTSAGGRTASGTVSASAGSQPQSPAPGTDKVEVSRSNQSQGSAGVSEEDLIAQNKRLQESKERVAALEKIVSDLQKLLEKKEQNLQDIKKQKNSSPAAGGEPPKTGRSGRPTASLDKGSEVAGQVFSTIDAYKVAA